LDEYRRLWLPAKLPRAGDFNHDGFADIVAPDESSGNVLVLLRRGDGSFQSPLESFSIYGADFMAAGLFNGDGNLDVAVASDSPYPSRRCGATWERRRNLSVAAKIQYGDRICFTRRC